MKTKPLFFFVLFLISLFIFFKLDHLLRKGVLSLGDEVRGGVLSLEEWVVDSYHRYFNQIATIEKLSSENEALRDVNLKNIQLQNELNQLLAFYNMPMPTLAGINPVRVLSYVELGNYNRVWLEDKQNTQEGFYGLISQGYVIGIAKRDENERMVGYLNGDPLCSYGVYIGKDKVLGILRSDESELKVDFIPLGSVVNEGDEVVTNGLDGIFFPNIPVGKIVRVSENNGYLSAEITLYAKNSNLGYLWLLYRSAND